jgi:hypothetical protein
METVQGTSAKGLPQQVDCWLDKHGRVAVWVHSPKNKGGGEIHVDPAELLHALIRVCLAQAFTGSPP